MAELEPLYSAEEMRAAEAGHDVDAMMQRAGAAVAEELMRRFPDARRVALHAGGGANGGDGQIAAEILRAQGRELVDERPDVVIDALLGTGLKGAPRDETSALIEQINASRCPRGRGRHPVRRERVHGRGRGRGGERRPHGDDARPQGRPRGRAGPLPRRRGGRRGHRPRAGGDRAPARHGGDPGRGAAPLGARQQVHGGPRPRRRRIARA